MKSIIATEAEQPEIYATVRRERDSIHRSVLKMAKQMRGLSDVSQKQAIAELTAAWIREIYPDNLELALSLSDAMREQTDIYLKEQSRRHELHDYHRARGGADEAVARQATAHP